MIDAGSSPAAAHARGPGLPLAGRSPRRWMLLYLTVFLPAGMFTVAGTSSMAAGVAVTCLVCLLARPQALMGWKVCLHALPSAAALIVALSVHTMLVASTMPFDEIRAAATLPLLLVFALGSYVLRREVFDQPPLALDALCKSVLLTLAALVPIAVAELIPAELFQRNKLVFPFSEPSVFALAGMPFLAYACIRATGWRRVALIFCGAVCAYLLKNLTMFVGLVLLSAICLRTRSGLVVALIVGSGALVLDISYFSERASINEDSENLSSLVYLQGWQLMGESLGRSHGLGIGLQQLGSQPTEVSAAELIYVIGQTELNLKDGGFVLAKLVSEFGVFGIAVAAWFTAIAFRCALSLRRAAMSGAAAPPLVFAQCVILFYSIDMFVRGAGYFTGTSLLCLASLQYLLSTRARRTHLRRPQLLRQPAGTSFPRDDHPISPTLQP